MTDIKELRRLAEAATQGEWKSMYTARKSNPSEKDKFYSVSALSPAIPGWCGAQNIDIATICKIYDGTDASNSEFIAAANPSAILSLLDKIDAQEELIANLRILSERYEEIIYSVGNKYPDETRHQTALRYIRSAETNGGEAKQSDTSTQEVG